MIWCGPALQLLSSHILCHEDRALGIQGTGSVHWDQSDSFHMELQYKRKEKETMEIEVLNSFKMWAINVKTLEQWTVVLNQGASANFDFVRLWDDLNLYKIRQNKS